MAPWKVTMDEIFHGTDDAKARKDRDGLQGLEEFRSGVHGRGR